MQMQQQFEYIDSEAHFTVYPMSFFPPSSFYFVKEVSHMAPSTVQRGRPGKSHSFLQIQSVQLFFMKSKVLIPCSQTPVNIYPVNFLQSPYDMMNPSLLPNAHDDLKSKLQHPRSPHEPYRYSRSSSQPPTYRTDDPYR